MPANTIITVRKGSSSAWVSANPVLASGELGFDTTNNILKIGNGTSDWNSLSNHRHSSADITNFNSSVSGLLPVKDIVASSGINIFSVSGIYTISSPEEVVEYLTAAQFPSSGNTSLLYIATDDSRVYRWTGFQYVEIGPTAFVPLSSGNFSTLQVNGTGVVASSGGNSGYLSKFTASNTIDDSIIYQSSGNIGINTTNPSYQLDVSGSIRTLRSDANEFLYYERPGVGNGGLAISASATTFRSSLPYRFIVGANEHVRIDSSGNVGIGTTTPSGRLDVRGNVYTSGNLGINNPAPSSVLDVIGESRMQGILYFNQNNTDANDSSRNRCKIERVSGQNLTLTGGSNTIQLAGDGGKILIRSSTVGTEIGGDGANTYVSFHPGSNVEKARITPAGSLGIGTSTPSGQLHIVGTGIISSRLGIGTNNPSVPLEVAGNAFIDGNLVFDSFTESVVTIGNSSSGVVLNIGSGTVQTCTLTNNCTFTMPATTAGKSFTMFLNTGSGNYTASFSGVLWNDSAPPTITTTPSKVDILSFISDGTYWYGSYSQNYG